MRVEEAFRYHAVDSAQFGAVRDLAAAALRRDPGAAHVAQHERQPPAAAAAECWIREPRIGVAQRRDEADRFEIDRVARGAAAGRPHGIAPKRPRTTRAGPYPTARSARWPRFESPSPGARRRSPAALPRRAMRAARRGPPRRRRPASRRAFLDVARSDDRGEQFANAPVRRDVPPHDRTVDVQHERRRTRPLGDQRREAVDVIARSHGDVPARAGPAARRARRCGRTAARR